MAPESGITDVRLLSGDERLRQHTKALLTLGYPSAFPDSMPAKLLRRATLACPGSGGECLLEFATAGDALTAELNAVPVDTEFIDRAAKAASDASRSRTAVMPMPVIYRVQPEYSEPARAARLQGSVILYLEVGPTGGVEKAEVIQSLGLGLDEKAIEAVKQWRFNPTAVKVEQSAEVRFVLSPAPSWRIVRAAYRVEGHSLQTSKPVLSQYTMPDDEPCLSGGGAAIVNLRIGEHGKPDRIKLIEEHGEGAGNAVMEVVPKWRFQPGLANGKRGEFTGTIEMACGAPAPTGVGEGSGGTYRIGGGVSQPVPIYRPDPDYSEEARKAKYQGTVIVSVQVDASGHVTNMRVVHPLGLGLDEKALEAINQWRFTPGVKDGVPVTVLAQIEVNFRLLN
jgi:TonB family protein